MYIMHARDEEQLRSQYIESLIQDKSGKGLDDGQNFEVSRLQNELKRTQLELTSAKTQLDSATSQVATSERELEKGENSEHRNQRNPG